MTLLNLVVLRSDDLERAAQFYARLGVEFTRHRHSDGPEHYAAEVGGTVFEIYPRPDKGNKSIGARIGFAVVDVDTVAAALVGAGGTIISEPADSPWGRRAVVADPDGHRVEITGVQNA